MIYICAKIYMNDSGAQRILIKESLPLEAPTP
jgi:hypothetical protein